MKSTVINALVAQIIATSKAVVGDTSKPVKAGKYAAIQELWDSKNGSPFGCQSENVATVIEGITGFRPASRGIRVKQFAVVVVGEGHALEGRAAIVLTSNGKVTLWNENTPTDTWGLENHLIAHLRRPTKSQVDKLHAAIKEHKEEFINAAKEHISLASLAIQ